MKPQIKRIEYGEHGTVTAIEFYEGAELETSIRIGIVLSNPRLDDVKIENTLTRAIGEFAKG